MHELDLAYSVVSVIDSELSHRQGVSLKGFELEIGEFSGVDYDAFKFSLNAILRFSPYASAEMIISLIEALYRCRSCNEAFRPTARCCRCPSCGSYVVEIVRGEELKLKSLIIDK
ncbi:MAG: hydrogenase maturation nickel metallochaperone HypA [Bacteroidales bacterium]